MAENLRTTRFNDDTSIPNVTDNSEWINLTTPGYSWYNNDAESYKTTYGALYNWYAVSTDHLCPTGWHVPKNTEFNTLTGYLGNDFGEKLVEKGNSHWLTYNTGVTNESGFTALPGGARYIYENNPDGKFINIEYDGNLWTSTAQGASGIVFKIWWDDYTNSDQYPINKSTGLTVRCIKDN
jgi:uncharacterized protein (TIGR02145 family)